MTTFALREQPVPQAPGDVQRWLSQFQIGVLSTLRGLSQLRIVQGVELLALPLTVGANTVSHRLGRPARGWIVTRQSAVLGLFETEAQLAQRGDQFFYLTATAAGVADLWVF